jgi:uncharacterized membrane protein YhhN
VQLNAAYLLTSAIAVLIAQFSPRWVFFAVKGVPMLVLIWSVRGARTDASARWRVAGLILSLGGALAIELSFPAGVVIFVGAQAAYGVSVPWRTTRPRDLAIACAAAAPVTAAIVTLFVVAVAPPLKLVVLAYAIAETVVIVGSLAAWLAAPSDGRARAMTAGTWLFAASDSALAAARWWRPFDGSDLVVQSAYFAGQWLIARSALDVVGRDAQAVVPAGAEVHA